MLFPSSNPKTPRLFPRWISWLFLGFLGYIMVMGNFSGSPEPNKQVESGGASSTQKYPKLAELADKEQWKHALNPDYVGSARWREIKEGDGEGAVCGGELTVKITGIAGTPDTPQAIKLGNAPYPVLDTALIGLKPGGIREISAPPDKVYAKPAKNQTRMVDFTVERVAGSPAK